MNNQIYIKEGKEFVAGVFKYEYGIFYEINTEGSYNDLF